MYARATRTIVAVSTVVSLLTPFAPAVGAVSCGTKSGAWTTLEAPRFRDGPPRITDLAVEARAPARMYATNGVAIVRSTDGGCSWQDSYRVGEESASALTPANARITSVVAAESRGRVLAVVVETVANQTRPHVVVSSDAGRSWEAGTGLPPLGSPEALVVAPSSPDTAYLAVDLSGGTLDTLYRSTDGGRTWQLRSEPHVGGEFEGLEVDPLRPNEIWAWGQGLHRSTDGGRTWTPIPEFVGTRTGPVDVFHSSGEASSIFVFIPDLRVMQQSSDGGTTWLQSYGLSAPDSVDHGSVAASRVATSDGNAFVWAPSLLQWVDADAPDNGVTDVSATRSTSPDFYMHTGSSILVFIGDTGPDIDIKRHEFDMDDIAINDPETVLDLDPPKLDPNKQVVKIPAGEEKRVRYNLSLSKIRTPLDLYFLVDTSESAKKFLRGLGRTLATIVNELYAVRLDVRFGLSEFRAYPDSEPPRPQCGDQDLPVVENPQCERNFIYRQVLDFPQSTPAALATATEGLVPIAGGHYNAQLEALRQVADGSGVDDWPYGSASPNTHLDGHDVPAGQDASFRKKALNIVLISTDEEFSTGAPHQSRRVPPEIPSFEEVAGSLNARDIHQVGLALGTGALPDLRRVAADTGAVAPSRGADCDGNGAADIAPGGPLVCTVDPLSLDEGSNLVPAIVNMVEAVRDTEAVTLEAESKDPVVDDVTPEAYPGVVLQADQDLTFDVTYRCPMTLAGERTQVDLTATQGGSELADGTATVVCGKLGGDKKDAFFDLYPIDRVLGLLPLLPLSPPPPLTNPSQATQAQSQAQAQGAMVTQEQEQPQVALASQYRSALREALAKEDEYLMTRYRERSAPAVPPGLFLGGAGLLMGAAYGVATSRRRRAAPAYARRR